MTQGNEAKKKRKTSGKECENISTSNVSFSDAKFERIYSSYYKRVFKFVQRYVALEAPAEELTQDIFLKIYQNREFYSPHYEFNSWLWSISKNTVFDYLRKLKSSLSKFKAIEDFPLLLESTPMTAKTAEEALIARDDDQCIHRLISALPSRQKEILTLRLVHQFSYEEISKKMNLSLSAVKSLLYRTKQTLLQLSQDPIISL